LLDGVSRAKQYLGKRGTVGCRAYTLYPFIQDNFLFAPFPLSAPHDLPLRDELKKAAIVRKLSVDS
jgi:hypothetical protein